MPGFLRSHSIAKVSRVYLWTYRDASGNFLDGAKTYKLHVLPNIPAKNFWSVVVYDTTSRSELQNGQPFPSISKYTNPKINDDGSIDVFFGPEKSEGAINWIKTVEDLHFFEGAKRTPAI